MLGCVTLKIKHLIRSCEWVKIRKQERFDNKAHKDGVFEINETIPIIRYKKSQTFCKDIIIKKAHPGN